MSNSLEYPNKKCTFAYRVVRRSKPQNISALALSLNRYHKSATPSFQSDTQSDISFLIILGKDTKDSDSRQNKTQKTSCRKHRQPSHCSKPFLRKTFLRHKRRLQEFLYLCKKQTESYGRTFYNSRRRKSGALR